MRKRYPMKRSNSRRSFSRNSGIDARNMNTNPMRGGYRF